MDRTIVKKSTLAEQDEAFCLSLSIDERLRLIEELNRQGRIMAGYAALAPMDRSRVCVRRGERGECIVEMWKYGIEKMGN